MNQKWEKYLIERRLLFQYLKATSLLTSWYMQKLDLKQRQPKTDGIYSFRINKQFRVFWEIKDNIFYVDTISNHQNK
jgi:plasmid maintenance system killer protein